MTVSDDHIHHINQVIKIKTTLCSLLHVRKAPRGQIDRNDGMKQSDYKSQNLNWQRNSPT